MLAAWDASRLSADRFAEKSGISVSNLRRWRRQGLGVPKYHRRQIAKRFALSNDVMRHTFISMFVAKYRSMGEVALQAGNSESIIRKADAEGRTQRRWGLRRYVELRLIETCSLEFEQGIRPKLKPEEISTSPTPE